MNSKSKQRKNNEDGVVVEEEIVTTTPQVKEGYESLYAPTDMSNDAMSGWRGKLTAFNDAYGGDIRGFENGDKFKDLSEGERFKYYTDLSNFESLYGTVSGYDNEWTQKQKEQKQAEEYVNTRRMLMEKYMPETLAAMGYANTGLAGDAVLKAQNQYENYLIDTRNEIAGEQSDILGKYRDQALTYDENVRQHQELQHEAYSAYYDQIMKGTRLNKNELNQAVASGAITPEMMNKLLAIEEEELTSYSHDGVSLVRGASTIPVGTDYETIVETMKNDSGAEVNNKSAARQEKFLNDVMTASKSWGEAQDGLLVDFNYGWDGSSTGGKGTIYMFKWNPEKGKGEWVLTNLDRYRANKNHKDKFYTGSIQGMEQWANWIKWLGDVRGNDFYRSTLHPTQDENGNTVLGSYNKDTYKKKTENK